MAKESVDEAQRFLDIAKDMNVGDPTTYLMHSIAVSLRGVDMKLGELVSNHKAFQDDVRNMVSNMAVQISAQLMEMKNPNVPVVEGDN